MALPFIDDLAARPGAEESVVTEWSVDPEDYGSFMNAIFDEWVQKDVGKVFVINLGRSGIMDGAASIRLHFRRILRQRPGDRTR
jgi:hypothetical protein